MPENSPVKSDYNSKWVIGACTEAKGVFGFDLKILKNLCSLRQFRSYKKKVPSWGGCIPPPSMPKGLKVSSYIWGKQWI